MEVRSKLLEKTAFNTRCKIEEHLLNVMKKSTHKGSLFQPLPASIKQFKNAAIFLTVYNIICKATSSNNNFCFTTAIYDHECSEISISQGVFELESLNVEVKVLYLKKVISEKTIIRFQSKELFQH